MYTRHIRRLEITWQAMHLVAQNLCDIQYKQSSRRRSPKCPQRPVIHHERVTPVSLDRKVTVRLREDAASSQVWRDQGPSANTFLHSLFLKPHGALQHEPRTTQQADGLARHCCADRRRGRTSSYIPSFQHQMARRVTTSLSLCRTLWVAIPPGTADSRTLWNH